MGALRTYLIPFSVAVMVVGITNLLLSGSFFSTGTDAWLDIFLVIFCTWAFSRASRPPKVGKFSQIIRIYDDNCDPQTFLGVADGIARRLRMPYNELSVWFLAPYGMALVDVGRRDEALELADSLRQAAEQAPTPHERASMLVNMEPFIERLFGSPIALPLLERAQELMDADPFTNDAGRRNYVAWERSMLQAQAAGNYGRLVELLREVRVRESCSMRLRVTCALRESVAHRALGDTSRERECLEFVVAHGSMLPAVSSARQRLAEL